MSPHRLLHVFSTFAAAGPQVRTTDILNRLPERYEHTVVAMDGVFEASARVHSRVPFRTLAPPPKAPAWKAPLKLGHFIKAQRPDLVLTYNWGATESILGARLAGVPVIHAEDGFGTDEVDGQKRRRVWTRRVLLRFVADLVVPSYVLEDAALRDWKAPPARTHRIPNGIDLQRFVPGDRGAARRALGVDPSRPMIGTVAKLRAEKALELMIDAFAILRRQRPAALWIAGDGPERPALERRAQEAGVAEDVHFAGVLEDPVPLLQALDLFALSSVTEQMPVSVLEAMGCGLPVVSSDVGDVARMVAEEGRELVLPGRDPEAHARAWAALLDDRARREALGEAQRRRCEQEYDREDMVRAYEALYARNLRGTATSP